MQEADRMRRMNTSRRALSDMAPISGASQGML